MLDPDHLKLYATVDPDLTILSAAGVRLQTKEHGELVDFESGCWAAGLGHSQPELVAILQEQAARLLHTHQFMNTDQPGALTRELCQAAGLESAYQGSYLSSGGEAVALAVLLAEKISGKSRKLCFKQSYLGAGLELRLPRAKERWLDLDLAPCLDCQHDQACSACPVLCSQGLDRTSFQDLGCFVYEPGNSGGAALFAPSQLISHLAASIRAAGGLVVVNEVTTGLGRTGRWFGFQHEAAFAGAALEPDLIALGKGLGNGYPVSGVLLKPRWAAQLTGGAFRYVQSHLDDPLGCRLARAVVAILQRDQLVERSQATGAYFRQRLTALVQRCGLAATVRGRGLMNVLAFTPPAPDSAQPVPAPAELYRQLVARGYFVGFSDALGLLRFYAPLTMERDDIDQLCHALELALRGNPTVKNARFCSPAAATEVQRLLAQSYWAAERSLATIQASLEQSISYLIRADGAGGPLVAYARVVTDRATMFWLCDVIVDTAWRGRGLGKRLMEAISLDPQLAGLKGILATRDAFGLYQQYGFVKDPNRFMDRPRK